MDKVKLGSVMTLHRGYDLPSSKREDGDVPVISSSGVSGLHSTAKLTGQNVITGRYGTIGEVFYHDGPCWPLNTTLYVSDFHGNNPRYAAYLLEAILASVHIDGGDKSTVPGVDRNVLHELCVPCASDTEEQISIASVLSAIDDKIANNKKLMVELEGTAQLVYDYWFTQFDFPDRDGRPYRSSGGKMVWSPELKREIPEGWEAGSLSSVASFSLENIAASKLTADTYVSVDSMIPNFGGISSSEYVPATGTCRSFTCKDVLFGNIRPYFKKVYQATFEGGCSPDVLVIRGIENAGCYVYITLARDIFIKYVVAGAKGTKMPRGDKNHIMNYPLAVPPVNLLSIYEAIASPILGHKSALANENNELASLRDWLLPMLMNGQVAIGNSDV